ncbi:alpha 1,2-mannosyltransferase 2.4.1 [Coemansia sp. Benny D115]|nr:alpha 1,2-mannosyltransferase 2.4.1 [Coemansia sp. Benny D115]
MINVKFTRILYLVVVVFSLLGIHHYLAERSTTNSSEKSQEKTGSILNHISWWSNGSSNGSDNSTIGFNGQKLMRAGIVALVRNSELKDIRSTIRQVDDRFNRDYGYPYILLNDADFTNEFMELVRATTKSPVYFGKLSAEHWGLSPYVTEEKVKAALEKNKDRYIYGGSFTYREMCRYQSGFIHKHPLLQNLDYYWRIEPGVDYYCSIPYDPFKYMKDNNLKYGFTISPLEFPATVETLWKTSADWMLKNPQHVAENNFLPWISDENGHYSTCHFCEAYQSYFEHLDKAGGFFYERWGDAPVHSLAAAMMLPKEQVHWFEDIGYHHPGFTHCPNKPEYNSRCICDQKQDYMYKSFCNKRLENTQNISREKALSLARIAK